MNRPAFALSLALLALTACGDHTLSISDYNKSCTANDQCIDVFIGEACSSCRCSNDAINISDRAAYQEDLDAAASCRLGLPACAADCISKVPVCQQGTCVLPP
jgi:hypothetical protein